MDGSVAPPAQSFPVLPGPKALHPSIHYRPCIPMSERQALLALVPGVKDVHLDKAMRRELALPSPEPVEPLDGGLVRKRPGRLQTRPTIGLWEDDSADMAYGRELLAAAGPTLPVRLGADKIWEQGHSGKGIKMGVFDTGIRGNHSHLRNIK